jgi:hypothetical protein
MFADTRVLLLEMRYGVALTVVALVVMMPAGRENYCLPSSTFQLDELYSVKYWSGI